MEKLIYRAVYCVVLVGMFWVVGCEDEDIIIPREPQFPVRSLQIVMADSTLEFLPGDSVSTSVIVIARDNNGLIVPNERVIVTLQNPLLGFLEFVDPSRRDTTNEQGQVRFVFRSYGQYGDNTILAQSGSVSTSLPFTMREAERQTGFVYVFIDDDSLTLFPSDSVTTAVTVLVRNQYQGVVPYERVQITLDNPTQGYILFDDPLRRDTTDLYGVVRFRYVGWNVGCNAIRAEAQRTQTVAPFCTHPFQLGSLVMDASDSTMRFDQGDSATAAVRVIVRDAENNRVPGVRVSATVSNPEFGYLELPDSNPEARTDSRGELIYSYVVFAEGCNDLTATVAGFATGLQICAEEQLVIGVIFEIENDSLEFFAGDTASTSMTGTARDANGNGVAGIEIDVDIIGGVGHIELVNPELGYVTDETGRLELVFWSIEDGPATIRVSVGGVGFSQGTLYVYQYHPRVTLLTIPGSIHFPSEGDSVRLELNLYENLWNRAIRDTVLSVWISGGELVQNPLPPTDEDGNATSWWRFHGVAGIYQAAVNYHGYTDTVTVSVVR